MYILVSFVFPCIPLCSDIIRFFNKSICTFPLQEKNTPIQKILSRRIFNAGRRNVPDLFLTQDRAPLILSGTVPLRCIKRNVEKVTV